LGSRNNLFRFSIPLTIRFGDMDAMGHVNHAKYLTYCEQARIEYFRQLTKRKVDEKREESIIIAAISMQFRAAAIGGDSINVFTRVSRMGSKSFDLAYEILHAERSTLLCEGSSVQVMYDYAAGRSIPIPDSFRRLIQDYEGDALA
jgi:acyl-CoA thioester hydrolase